MPISPILTPFDHSHFRPALAVKCIHNLRICHTSSFIKHISLLAPKDLLLHSLSLMSSIVSDNCNLEYFSDFCKGFQNLKRHWIPWLNIFSFPIFWEGSRYLYHAKDIYRVLALYFCVHQLTDCEWNEPNLADFTRVGELRDGQIVRLQKFEEN